MLSSLVAPLATFLASHGLAATGCLERDAALSRRIHHPSIGAPHIQTAVVTPGCRISGSFAMPPKTPRWHGVDVRMCSAEAEPSGSELEAMTPRYGVYLHDDSFNMREYVARTLMMICEISESDADSIMMQANWGGRALVGTWEKELAEHTYNGMTKAGLAATITRVDGDDEGDDDEPAGMTRAFMW